MIEYASINMKTWSAEYARIPDVPDAMHSLRSLYKLLSSYWGKGVFKTLSDI